MAEGKPDLLGMVDALEGLLHNELPDVARGFKGSDGDVTYLQTVVDKIDDLQRQIGMATFEMIRRGEAPPSLGRERFSRVVAPDDPYEDPVGIMRGGVAPADGPTATDGPAPLTPRCTGCKVFAVGNCDTCGKPFCARDIHPSMHPCGDL